METPKNCWECPHTESCPAPHYGGSRCTYEEEIYQKTIEALLPGKPKE